MQLSVARSLTIHVGSPFRTHTETRRCRRTMTSILGRASPCLCALRPSAMSCMMKDRDGFCRGVLRLASRHFGRTVVCYGRNAVRRYSGVYRVQVPVRWSSQHPHHPHLELSPAPYTLAPIFALVLASLFRFVLVAHAGGHCPPPCLASVPIRRFWSTRVYCPASYLSCSFIIIIFVVVVISFRFALIVPGIGLA